MCNTYCCSTATTVSWTQLNITSTLPVDVKLPYASLCVTPDMRQTCLCRILMWFSSFTFRPLYTYSRSSGTDWTRGWVGHRARLDTVADREIPQAVNRSSSSETWRIPVCLPGVIYHKIINFVSTAVKTTNRVWIMDFHLLLNRYKVWY